MQVWLCFAKVSILLWVIAAFCRVISFLVGVYSFVRQWLRFLVLSISAYHRLGEFLMPEHLLMSVVDLVFILLLLVDKPMSLIFILFGK